MNNKFRNFHIIRKALLTGLSFFMLLSSCTTKQIIIDTGTTNPLYDGSIMKYLRADNYNWELTVEMIERAGLTDLFEGQVDTLPQITFWGPTSLTIFRFLMDTQNKTGYPGPYYKVADIPVATCREYILKHVTKGKYLKEGIGYRNLDYDISSPDQNGGTVFKTIYGNSVRAFLTVSSYGGVSGAGPTELNLFSITAHRIIPMATPDIQPTNGVIHALNYGYEFPDI